MEEGDLKGRSNIFIETMPPEDLAKSGFTYEISAIQFQEERVA
jgi:hypothetical protein